jgi:hypothetical protein
MGDCSLLRPGVYETVDTVIVRRERRIRRVLDQVNQEKHLRNNTQTALAFHSDNGTWPNPPQSILVYVPTCPETRLSNQCAEMVWRFQWDQKWTGLVPTRIGYDRSLDLAVSALLEAQRLRDCQFWTTKAKSVRFYLDAIKSIQAAFSAKSFWTSEQTQLAVGILARYEATQGPSRNSTWVACCIEDELVKAN